MSTILDRTAKRLQEKYDRKVIRAAQAAEERAADDFRNARLAERDAANSPWRKPSRVKHWDAVAVDVMANGI